MSVAGAHAHSRQRKSVNMFLSDSSDSNTCTLYFHMTLIFHMTLQYDGENREELSQECLLCYD